MSCSQVTKDIVQGTMCCATGLSLFVGLLTAAVCAVALLILLKNHIDARWNSQWYSNVPLLKPHVAQGLWDTAKWSSIISGSCFGWVIFSFACFVANKK